ncbi:MAG: hypothetical protein IJY38_04410 [Clostridia bacterium]|nr:hypothetical protein [Clostridia bacterium]
MFGIKKKLSLDEILKGVENLTPEEQQQFKAKMDDLYKAEDERKIDKIEEEKNGTAEVKDEKAEEVSEESEEVGKDLETNEDAIEGTEEKVETHEEGDAQKWANVEKRLTALEETVKGYARQPKETDKSESDKLNDLAKKFE